MQKFPQCVLGEVISRVSRPPEPQFRLLVIGENAPPVPPALAQLIGGQGETSLPELLQHPHLLRLFALRVLVLLQYLLGTLVDLGRLPVIVPGVVHRILICIRLVPHAAILEGKFSQTEPLRLPDDHVLDGFELLLLGEGQVFSGRVFVVMLQLVPELVPLLVALGHLRDIGQFVHDGVHLHLYRLFQVAVDLLALVVLHHPGQRLHLLRDDRTVAQACLHLPDEPPHGLHRRVPHLAVGQIFFLVDRQQLVPEDLIGQLGAHFFDALFREIPLLGVRRPGHHVDVGMVFLIVEGGTPTKTAWRNFHRCR